MIGSIFVIANVHFGNAQTATQSATFQLYDSNGNQISEVVFGNVAPGASSTYTCTMSSSDRVTVYPIWNVSNLPVGDTISGYWNGPEVWNVNTGRMWNTWDTVTLQWTLSVPANGNIATNIIVNVVVNGATPTTPTPTVIISSTPYPTASPIASSTQSPSPSTNLWGSVKPIVGVKVGDWVSYSCKALTNEPNTVSPEWANEQIASIQGTSITISETERFTDGSSENNQHLINLQNPADPNNPDVFLYPANMSSGDTFGPGISYAPAYELHEQYCGSDRIVISFSTTTDAGTASFAYDKQTGFLLHFKSNEIEITALQTNLWGSQGTNTANLWTIFTAVFVVVTISVAILFAILFRRKRRSQAIATEPKTSPVTFAECSSCGKQLPKNEQTSVINNGIEVDICKDCMVKQLDKQDSICPQCKQPLKWNGNLKEFLEEWYHTNCVAELNQENQLIETKEKEVIVKVRCPVCKNTYHESLVSCPYCEAKRL